MSNIRFEVHVRSNPNDTEEVRNVPLTPDQQQAVNETHYSNLDAWIAIIEMVSQFPTHGNRVERAELAEAMAASANDQDLRRQERCIDIREHRHDAIPRQEKTCDICTHNYNAADIVSELDCSHVFHSKCIREWARYKADCPLCRAKIPVVMSKTVLREEKNDHI